MYNWIRGSQLKQAEVEEVLRARSRRSERLLVCEYPAASEQPPSSTAGVYLFIVKVPLRVLPSLWGHGDYFLFTVSNIPPSELSKHRTLLIVFFFITDILWKYLAEIKQSQELVMLMMQDRILQPAELFSNFPICREVCS